MCYLLFKGIHSIIFLAGYTCFDFCVSLICQVLTTYHTHTQLILVQPCSFLFVSRCAKSFAGEFEWVFWCSCDQARASLVNAIGSHVEMEYSAFHGRFQPCIHIDAVKILLSHVDALNDVSPTVEFAGMSTHCIYQSINQSIFLCYLEHSQPKWAYETTATTMKQTEPIIP